MCLSYSLRICLIRAIASSTACSGLMHSGHDAMDRFLPDLLCKDTIVLPVVGLLCGIFGSLAGSPVHSRTEKAFEELSVAAVVPFPALVATNRLQGMI
jgi:hypothetical protein